MLMKTMRNDSVAMLLVMVLAGCGTGGGGDFNLISLEQEWQLGEQLSRDIARQVRLVNDPEAVAYVNRVGRALVGSTEMGRLPWQFHIVADPNINAFNIPGGHVYVNTGLIAAADNASEFAGVLGHEIAHGVERHATEQLTRAYGLEIIAALVLGQQPGQLERIVAQIVGTGALARFSREAEEEADRLGTRMMVEAGYDPRGMVTMFEELMATRRGRPGAVSQFFSTHPLTEDRIRAVSKQIEAMGTRSGLRTDEPDYQRLRRSVS
jgi:predicted Zn-dependent protease